MGNIFQIKISKGGVGKTFLTVQLASLLAALNKKVLIITTDPQNDVYGMLKPNEITEDICDRGLKEGVLHGECDIINMRENLYYIPLEFDGYFSPKFFKRLPAFFKKLRKEYDYILIDSNPAPKTDNEFLKISDYVIIPTIGSSRSLRGAVSVFENVKPEKVIAIVFNQFKKTKLQENIYNELKEFCKTIGRLDLLTDPIPYQAIIEELSAQRKTIWECKSQKVLKTKKILIKLVEKIVSL